MNHQKEQSGWSAEEHVMDNSQIFLPPPLTKERVAQVRARIAELHDDLRRQGIDPTTLADPVELLKQARDAQPVESR